MPPGPPPCQGIADRVLQLEQQYREAAARASAAIGVEAWTELAQAGALLQQLDRARAELSACVKAYSTGLTGRLVAIGASGGFAPGSQSATLWDLTGAGPVPVERVEIDSGEFGFAGPLPASAAVSLAASLVDQPFLPGVDFRSGLLPEPQSQPMQIEIVVAPRLTLSAQTLREWASTYQSTPQEIDAGGYLGPLQAVIAALALTFTSEAVQVDVTGTVTRASEGPLALLVPPSMPFAATIRFSLAAATDPRGTELIAVALAGQNAIVVDLPGLQTVGEAILPLLTPFVADQVRASLSASINRIVSAAIARGFALESLPPTVQLSLRSLTIAEHGITIEPVVGAVGTTLSTFQPTTLTTP